MNPIFAGALEVQAFCRARRWKFCFIGALAVQRWGEPRLTQDVDLTVMTPFGVEEPYVNAFLDVFKAFAGREKDWLDIEGIALRQHGRLDETLIWTELTPLLELKDAPQAAARLRAVLASARDR